MHGAGVTTTGEIGVDLIVETAQDRRPVRFDIARMVNLGSATRDTEAAIAHQKEVAQDGINIAYSVPSPRIYPIGTHALSTGSAVQVHGDDSSGEVEIVLLMTDRLYIGVGSDHTDRALERTSIVWSKQTCANVLAPVVWPYDEVAADWDRFVLRSQVDGRPYQDVGTAEFLRPEEMLRIVHERAPGLPERGLVVFGGTFVSLDKKLGFGRRWEFSLTDPVSGRSISHGYDVVDMMQDVAPQFRVPLHNPAR